MECKIFSNLRKKISLTSKQNNCTFCMHYKYKWIEEKTKGVHCCCNFIKLGETIKYNCENFEARKECEVEFGKKSNDTLKDKFTRCANQVVPDSVLSNNEDIFLSANDFYRKKIIESSKEGVGKRIAEVMDIDREVKICQEYASIVLSNYIKGIKKIEDNKKAGIDVKTYLETQKLILCKNMNGYEIPYAYLCTLIEEYTPNKIYNYEKLMKLYQDYIKFMGEELDEIIDIAHSQGWESKRYEEGKKRRMEISKLLNKL